MKNNLYPSSLKFWGCSRSHSPSSQTTESAAVAHGSDAYPAPSNPMGILIFAALLIGLMSQAVLADVPRLIINPAMVFPMRLSGAMIGNAPNGGRESPLVYGSPACFCPSKAGVPAPGMTLTYNALRAGVSVLPEPMNPALKSLSAASTGTGSESTNGFQVAVYPLPDFLEYLSVRVTKPVPVYMTEVDPFFQDDIWTSTTPPSNMSMALGPAGPLACGAEATTASFNQNMDNLFWCAGSWGTLYPLSRNVGASVNHEQAAYLTATKVLALLSSRGMLWRSQGLGTACNDMPMPMFIKSLANYGVDWTGAVVPGKPTSLLKPVTTPYRQRIDIALFMSMRRCINS